MTDYLIDWMITWRIPFFSQANYQSFAKKTTQENKQQTDRDTDAHKRQQLLCIILNNTNILMKCLV